LDPEEDDEESLALLLSSPLELLLEDDDEDDMISISTIVLAVEAKSALCCGCSWRRQHVDFRVELYVDVAKWTKHPWM
jgi:hypothetical protein